MKTIHDFALGQWIQATILALATSVAAAAPNVVVNGDFETGNLSGWTLSGSNLDFTDVDCFGGCIGNYAFDSGSQFSPAFISQSVPTVAGATYTLSLLFQSDGQVPNELRIDIANATVYDAIGVPTQGFTPVSLQFAATSAFTNLRLGLRSDPGFLQIDNISVQAVPEPSTWLMLAAGLGLVALRKGRQSGRTSS